MAPILAFGAAVRRYSGSHYATRAGGYGATSPAGCNHLPVCGGRNPALHWDKRILSQPKRSLAPEGNSGSQRVWSARTPLVRERRIQGALL